jgi:hypothetical protein
MVTTQTPPKTNIHVILSVAGVCLLLILFASYALRSTGSYYDDDIAHYLIARFSWYHPELFFDRWGRPAFTLLYAPIALLGFGAVRLYSALIAAATCLGGLYLARLYQVRWYWLAAVFIGLQPEFLRQAFSSLTELTFAFVFCLALIAYKKQSWVVMALAVGWLPLARYESLPIVGVFALILIQRRKFYLLALVAAPLLVQNGFWAVQGQNLSLLLFPLDHVLGPGPNHTIFDYGTGDALFFIRLMPAAYGGLTLVLAGYGALRERFGILHLCILLAIGTLSIAYWLLPTTGIAGYARYLAVVSPAVGVLAAIGLDKLLEGLAARFRAARPPLRAAITGVTTALVVVAMAASTLSSVQPFYLTQEQQIEIQAAQWLAGSPYQGRLVLGSDTYFVSAAGIDQYDSRRYLPITRPNIDQSPAGSIIVWDSHYSGRLIYNTPLQFLRDTTRFRPLQSWNGIDSQVYIFEKLG